MPKNREHHVSVAFIRIAPGEEGAAPLVEKMADVFDNDVIDAGVVDQKNVNMQYFRHGGVSQRFVREAFDKALRSGVITPAERARITLGMQEIYEIDL